MRKIKFTLLALPFLLTGCSISIVINGSEIIPSKDDTSSSEEPEEEIVIPDTSGSGTPITFSLRNIPLYNLTGIENNGRTIASNKKMRLGFKRGEELTPYITLESYSSIYSSRYAVNSNLVHDISTTSSTINWNIKIGTNTYSSYSINTETGDVSIGGYYLSSLYDYDETNYDRSSIFIEVSNVSQYVVGTGTEVENYNFKDAGYEAVSNGDTFYFPLSMLEAIFGYNSNLHLFYNYRSIYQYGSYSDFSSITFHKEGEVGNTSVYNEMKDIVERYDIIPESVLNDNMHALSFIFNNNYGLRDINHASPFIDFLTNHDIYNKFMSGSRDDFTDAMTSLLRYLDDGHTGSFSITSPWFKDYSNYNRKGEHVTNINNIRTNLESIREQKGMNDLTNIYYSNDNSLAFFTLDSFSNYKEVALDNHDNPLPNLYEYDDYYYLKHQLETIKSTGTTSKVVIDISTNGGGIVQTMMKMVSLLSSTNSVRTYWKDGITGSVMEYYSTIQSEVYGDDFNFYILTSGYSFSCANYFPFILQKNNLATIIGQTSGGGECTVNYNTVLPTGIGLAMSSNNHLGYYDGVNFIGDEDGAPVEASWQIDYSNYYDIELINNLINSH